MVSLFLMTKMTNNIFADMTKEENLSLSNESQYLLISRPSVQELLSKIKERQSNENEAGEQIGMVSSQS